MKQSFGKYLFGAGLLMLAVPATSLAQKEKEKDKDAKEVEQIIITRRGDGKEKTVIEINGDAIIVNGKNAKEINGNITVQRIRDVNALLSTRIAAAPRAYGGSSNSFNFEMNNDGMTFYREDSSRAMLGVVTSEDSRGARINTVSKESGAEKAGLKAGDVITRINDAKIDDADDVTKAVRKQKPGDKVNITYLRDGKEQKAVAELGRWKGLRVNADNMRVMTPGHVTPMPPNARMDMREFGFEASSSRPRMGLSVQDSEDGKGVVVKSVEAESNAAKAGIKEGDVITQFNGEEINSVDELRSEMADNREKITVPVKLMRNGKEQSLEVRMPRKLKTANL